MQHTTQQKVIYKRGQAALLVVIIFLALSLVITFGIISPVLRHASFLRNMVETKKSYFLAEAGLEDVIYRLRRGMQTSSVNTLMLDGEEVETTVTDVASGKLIRADADYNNYLRSQEVELSTGTGMAFFYGLQTGTGGITLDNNAVVTGNVYSNGAIVGGNGSRITGSAYSANSAALGADQTNDTPSTPLAAIQFGHGVAEEDFAQSFVLNNTGPVNKVSVNLRKTSNPGNLTIRIVSDNNGSPSTNTITSATLSASLVTSSFGWVDVPLSSNPELTSGTTYWLIFDGGNSSNKYYEMAANTAYAAGTSKIGRFTATWNNVLPTSDGYFKVYLGGLTGSIDGVTVGQSGIGDAHAHSVDNSTIAGNLYCQTGSSNNKSCNTSRPDPTPQPFPLSQGNINAWQTEALQGGTYNGNISLSDSASSLGPRKINGNLTIDNNYILTMTGTLWVTGNLVISNGSTIRLAAGYGTGSGVIIVDGYVLVSNGSTFVGSGNSESFVMVISTSGCPTVGNCSGNDAIHVGNNAGAVLLNAQNGTVSFANNSAAKSATAALIHMQNNAQVSYDTGLVNVNFVSGPSGGYDIVRWREVE